MNVFFQFLQICICKLLQRIVLLKQRLCHNVHPRIRALGTQDHCDQQLPWRIIIQKTPVLGAILRVQQL